jgi:hypothetical protein
VTVIDLEQLATIPTWLEAIEVRKQCGMSAMEFGERLTRFGDISTPEVLFDDVELMEAFSVALWLAARRAGARATYAEYVAGLTLDDFTAVMQSVTGQAPANRAARRAKKARKKHAG